MRILLILTLFLSFNVVAEQEKKPALLDVYPNSIFMTSSKNEFMQYTFPLKTPSSYKAYEKQVTKQGELAQFAYELPDNSASALQVFTNYKDAITKAGGEVLFECLNSKCEGKDQIHVLHVIGETRAAIVSHEMDKFGYLTASINQKGNQYYVGLIAGQFKEYTRYELVILKEAEMDKGLVSVNQLTNTLENQGKIALYGILFDTNKASIKAESRPTINNIAEFLSNNDQIRVFVVGHTDNTGNLGHNLSLSENRAKSVVKALTEQGVANTRLIAKGVGPLSPVTSNATEAGKTKNRRVEIVVM